MKKEENKQKPEEREEYQTLHFRDGIEMFLSYSERQLDKNPDYQPHPILRAFNMALTKFEEVAYGEYVIGVSGNDGKHVVSVVLKKEPDHALVANIIDMNTGQSIPVELMFKLFRLQTKMDSYPEGIPTKELVQALNEIFTEFHFHYLGDRWEEARDLFVKRLEEGKIKLRRDENTDKLVQELTSIKKDTPWEEYPGSVRGLIGGSAAELFDKRPNSVTITTPDDVKNDAGKIFDIITFQYLGSGAKFFGFDNCLFCGEGEDTVEIVSIWDHHLLLANKYPTHTNQFLIVPKTHTRAICDLPIDQIREAEEMIEAMIEYYKDYKIEEYSFIESGFVLQSVYHSHIHAIPTKIDPEKDWGIKLIDKQNIKTIEEGVDFYKKHGSYLLVQNNSGLYIGKPELDENDQRSISELIDGLKWKEVEDPKFKQSKEKLFDSTCESWNNWKKVRNKKKE